MNVKEIQKLMEAFQRSGLTEMDLTDETFNLKLKREVVGETVTTPPQVTAVQPPATAPMMPVAVSEAGEVGVDTEQDGLETIESPIIGTFYRSSSPEADPYIAIGDVIRKGQVLCIIEAMKIMNEIESEIEGTVVKIFPKNAEAVEYGQKLFAVKPV